MPEKINSTLSVLVDGGPKIADARELKVDAYDKVVVTVPANTTDEGLEVEVQPGAAGKVRFLLISSSAYDEDVSYSVNADEVDAGNRIQLDDLQVFMGSGAVGLLKPEEAPQKLYFYNALAEDVTVSILVGRLVTA